MVKRAVLIGINYNNVPDLKLRGCINDAIVMRNMLIDAYGYERKNISMLRDDGLDYELPTKYNILKTIENMCNITSVSDELWIHYSGHGTYVRDRSNDENDNYDEVIIPLDNKTNGHISDEELKELLQKASGTIFITQDCCNSGTGWDLPYRFTLNSSNRTVLHRESTTMPNNNIYMFSGARDDQLAADTYDNDIARSIGAFTNAFIECLRSSNHNIKMIDLRTNINSYLEEKGYTQRSEFSSSNITPDNVTLTRSGLINNNPPLARQELGRPTWLQFL